MLWCGLLNGLCCINGFSWFASPEILYIFVVSNDSSKFISGSIEGNLLANIVFPTPGLPIKQQLCPPAATISKALFTLSCPLTSEKSTSYLFSVFTSIFLFSTSFNFWFPFKYSISSFKYSTGNICIPSIIDASFIFSFGSIILFIPSLLASITIAKIPFTFSIFPFNDNSPIKAVSFKNLFKFQLLLVNQILILLFLYLPVLNL